MGEAVADKNPVELVSVFLATTTKHRVGAENCYFPRRTSRTKSGLVGEDACLILTCVMSSYSLRVSYGP